MNIPAGKHSPASAINIMTNFVLFRPSTIFPTLIMDYFEAKHKPHLIYTYSSRTVRG